MGANSTVSTEFRRQVRFVLDGKAVELEDVDPSRTVLQFLREDLSRTGTKEGCAEGDCGACTVVVADIDASGRRLQTRAINSCIQFLPTLDGKEILTVESLASGVDRIHPVQQAMVDQHGSQCGFCTPGFVMSLFALFKNNATPSRREIDQALAGNLCRCTGYKPIVAAAQEMVGIPSQNEDWRFQLNAADPTDDERKRVALLESIRNETPLKIVTNGQQFYSPRNIAQLASLVEAFPTATILAGGTDVGLWVTKQHQSLDTIIYIGNVSGLDDIATTDTHLEIGAACTLTDAMTPLLELYPELSELLMRFASPPIRNAGTLGGNIANGSPIGDSMPALLVLQADLVLRNGEVTRTLPLGEFYLDYQKTALRQGEFVERVLIPTPVDGVLVRSYKISKRFDQDISAVCAAFSLHVQKGVVTDFRAAYGGMAAIPARASHCEQALLGKNWNRISLAEAKAALDDDFEPLSDMRSSADYRSEVSKNLLERLFLESENNDEISVYHYGR